MLRRLAKKIKEEKSEILSGWIKQIKALGGSYAQVSDAELVGTTSEFLVAFTDILSKGNFLKLRQWIEKISYLRSSRGFRVSEVQRAIYSIYGVLKPFIQRLEQQGIVTRDVFDKINNILSDILFELSEAYHKKLNERIDSYITEIENANLKLKETSIKDSLTGCYNHRYFYDILESEVSRAKRYGRPISIAMFDIDHFKKFNDKFGHLFGDEVLKGVGAILRKSVRSSDIVFRYGGEEFSIILPETKKEMAFIFIERLKKQIAGILFEIKGKKAKITISGGVEGFEEKPLERDVLIANADKALYLAKKKGRNRVVLFGKTK